MFDNRRFGKTLVVRGLHPLLVMIACVLAGTADTEAALAQPGSEEAWVQMVRGNKNAAGEAAAGKDGILDRWIRAELTLSPTNGAATASDQVFRAAAAFTERDFGSCLESVTALLTDAENADRTHLLLRQGACLVELNRISEADSVLTVAIGEAKRLDLPVSECFGLLHRGRGRVRTRQVEPPRADLTVALEMCRQLDLPSWGGRAAIALSVVSRLQMNLPDALQWRRRALELYRAAGDIRGQAIATHYIGAIQQMQGDLTRAIQSYQDALVLARQSGVAGTEGSVLGEMAGANYLLGDYDQALDQYREAIRLAENPWRRGMMLINIGSILEYRGEYEEAIVVQREALELMRQVGDHRSEAAALASLGETLCEMKRFTEGLAYLDQAVTVARQYDMPMYEAFALKSKGHGLFDSGDNPGAMAALTEATTVARSIDYFEILEYALLGQAMVARREGNPAEALLYLEEAMAEVAEVRRRSSGASDVTSGIVGQAGGIFREAIDLLYLLHQQDPGRQLDRRAFAIAQQAKARAFLDLLAEAEFDLRYSAVPGYRQTESEILTRIIGLEKRLVTAVPDSAGRLKAELAAAEDELQVLEARLRAEDPRYAAILYPEPMGLDEVQSGLLAPGELFLEYALGDSASYVWAIDSQGAEMVALPPGTDIEAKVRELLPLLQDINLTGGDLAWLAPTARELGRLLLDPVREKLQAADRVTVSPDGILHYLPFETLLTDDTTGPLACDLPWLIRDKVVAVTPSASVLATVTRRLAAAAASPWLLVGDPLLVRGAEAGLFARAAGARDLAPLPHVPGELDRLGELAPASGSRQLRAEKATVAGVRENGADGPWAQVHFATHGLMNEDRPRYSGLVLSPDPTTDDDGFLSVSDVFGLRLNCDQVVLSACSTALGENVSGEGLVGLTQGFMFAGARCVLASLWDVSGKATAAFMSTYYTHLATGANDRAEALAATKRTLICGDPENPAAGLRYSHPAFWSAFVLSGQGR
ncbi:MAG: CHAT domain-containing tetratricopeptide repeat protein [Candidatus Krumholzibacteriota bacterium]